ncbi:MAG: radical SAM/SPASM family putative metalloenzyme maturase [Desulfuromonadaceae bacterium]|nr:radical SAM/SPASM family putative metalloenzyme maturase [Desulfuromonadaceae bacterium]
MKETIQTHCNIDADSSRVALREYPTKLFVETTTRCNLSCFMCVKQNRGSDICEGDFSPELFTRLEAALPHVEVLILNGIGEPLLNPHLELFIRAAKELMPSSGWVGFQSNGVLMTPLRAESLIDAGLDTVCISVDAVAPEQFKKLREGGNVEAVDMALAALNNAKVRCNRPEVKIGIEFVAMSSNIGELPATLEWAASRGARFAIVTHVLPYDELHAHEAVFCNITDQALALYNVWRRKAIGSGVDMQRYYEVRWKYTRTDDEQAIVDLVEAMKAEAEQQGIMLDMKKLLQLEHQRVDEIAAVFAAAEAVAERTGLELRLPELALKEQRKCSFVEGGSAFVSWNGDVSPCYFLWHRFECFASGWNQTVKPKVFGNLAEQEMLGIWNNQEFTSFRTDVLAYDYPSCASCGLAPCDYIQTDDFQQDCHIRNVPCGSCLWCMGVFQCLR